MRDQRPAPDGDGVQRHRALASPSRNRVLSALRSSETPLGVQDLAVQIGLHPNTVRSHLTVLEEAGLVVSQREDRDKPGRPRLVFSVTAAAAGEEASEENDHGYRFLAQVLASYLEATASDPSGAAEDAGAAWGRHLIDRADPFETVQPAEAVQRTAQMLHRLGFAAEVVDDEPTTTRLLLHRCPFLDVAREHQRVVCGVHLGLMRGALDELTSDVRAAALHPFVTPTLCVSHLEVSA